jgi:predicted amidohydrolase
LRVGLVQTRTPATHAAALEHVAPLVREAAARGARFILTPEGVNVLQKDRARLLPTLVSLDDDPVVNGLRDLARELDVWIDVGSALVKREDGKAANRQAVIDPTGAIVATYDKLHMFDVDLPTGETARESATYEPGDRAAVVETPLGTFGLTICYDMRFPALHRALALGGAQVLTVPGRLHPADRRGALGHPAAGPGHRDRLVRDRRGPGRLPRGRPRHLGPLDRHRPVGRGDRKA